MSMASAEGAAVNPAIDVVCSGAVVKAPPRKNRWSLFVMLPAVRPWAELGSSLLEVLLSSLSWHHSHTLPCMSKRPRSLGRSVPTGCEWLWELKRNQAHFASRSSASPTDHCPKHPARQAYSHSVIIGSR